MDDQQYDQHREATDNPGNILPNDGRNSRAGDDKTSENSEIYLGDSSLQTPEEFEKDKSHSTDQGDKDILVSTTDDLQSNSDGAAGTDRAGTAERKPYGDTELNKGLESQAKDSEGTSV